MPIRPGEESEVGWLTAQERKVKARCLVCETIRDVDLQAILLAKGPLFSLSNRRPHCHETNCPGRVIFEDWSRMWPVSLDTIKQNDPAWWEMNDLGRREAEAAGWRIESGHWIDPQGRSSWERRRG